MAPPNTWSSHHVALIRPLARAAPASSWGQIASRDWIALRAAPGATGCAEIELEAKGAGAALGPEGVARRAWRPAAEPTLRLRLEGAPGAATPPFLSLRCTPGRPELGALLMPAQADAWHRWRREGPVDYSWLGGDIVDTADPDAAVALDRNGTRLEP
jgi:hypothetical protein